MNWKFWKTNADEMPDADAPDWERALINKMALAYLQDQRRRRRWGWVLRVLILVYLLALLAAFYAEDLADTMIPDEEHTALVEVKGVIAADTQASADKIVTALRDAFDNEQVKGIILRINSPGGSPVQAGYVNDEIRRLKAKYTEEKDKEMPVYAVAVDLCASGGYYIAVAADEIYADKASIVGSIGVRIDSFGLDKAIEELGIERRLLTAGANKGILDPFLPLSDANRAFLQSTLDRLHDQFIAEVKEGRGDRLQGDDEDLFSGLFWSGEQGVELGLIDGLGSSSYVARELIEAETIVTYTKKKDLLETLTDRFGAAIAGTIAAGLGWTGQPAWR